MGLRAKVLTGLRWIAVARISTQLISWASTVVVIRLLQPEDYGLIAMAAIFVSFCQLINELGLGSAIVQKEELTELHLRQIFSLVLILNGSLFILLLAGSPLIASFFDEPKLNSVIPVLSLQFIFIAFSVIPNSILTKNMNFRVISIISIFSSLSSSVATFVMAWSGLSYWALVFGSLTGVLINTICLNIVNPFFKRPCLKFSDFGGMARFGFFVSMQRILWYIYSHADVFIIGKMLGKTTLGYYSVAMNLASLPLQKVGGIINQVGLPAYSKLQKDRDLAQKYALKAVRVISFIAFPVFLGISCTAPVFIGLLIGEKWISSVLPIQLLSLVFPLKSLSLSLGPAVNGLGRPDINMKNMAVACCVMPVAFLIGINWGLKGVSIAWVIGYPLWFFYMLSQSLPAIGLTLRSFLKAMHGPAIIGAIMYFVVYMIRIILNKSQVNDILTFVILIAAGIITYSAIMIILYKDICMEVWDLRHA